MTKTRDDNDNIDVNLKFVSPTRSERKHERGSGPKGRHSASARAYGARGRTVGREEKRVSTTGGGRPNVVSAAAQRDKQLKRGRRKSNPTCVSIHPSVVYTTRLSRRDAMIQTQRTTVNFG